MISYVNAKIADLSTRMKIDGDRKDLETIRKLIIQLSEENERLKHDVAYARWGSEYINDMHEQIRSFENNGGYCK